jgi:alpha-galactosidase
MHRQTYFAVLLALHSAEALVRDGGIVCFLCFPIIISTEMLTLMQGRLPALGWNSWNAFHCDVNETDIMTAANEIVSLGLKDAGYEYVNSIILPLLYT